MVSQIPTEFHVFRRTQDTFKRERSFDYGVVTSTTDLSRSLRLPRSFVTPYRMSTTPRGKPLGLGYVPFRSPLLRKSHLLSSSRYLDVSVPGSVFLTLCIQIRIPYHYVWWVSPFGNLRIKAYLQLPKHIGVSPVLHRLLVSRHPPCALSNLTKLKIKNMSYTVI